MLSLAAEIKPIQRHEYAPASFVYHENRVEPQLVSGTRCSRMDHRRRSFVARTAFDYRARDTCRRTVAGRMRSSSIRANEGRRSLGKSPVYGVSVSLPSCDPDLYWSVWRGRFCITCFWSARQCRLCPVLLVQFFSHQPAATDAHVGANRTEQHLSDRWGMGPRLWSRQRIAAARIYFLC